MPTPIHIITPDVSYMVFMCMFPLRFPRRGRSGQRWGARASSTATPTTTRPSPTTSTFPSRCPNPETRYPKTGSRIPKHENKARHPKFSTKPATLKPYNLKPEPQTSNLNRRGTCASTRRRGTRTRRCGWQPWCARRRATAAISTMTSRSCQNPTYIEPLYREKALNGDLFAP